MKPTNDQSRFHYLCQEVRTSLYKSNLGLLQPYLQYKTKKDFYLNMKIMELSHPGSFGSIQIHNNKINKKALAKPFDPKLSQHSDLMLPRRVNPGYKKNFLSICFKVCKQQSLYHHFMFLTLGMVFEVQFEVIHVRCNSYRYQQMAIFNKHCISPGFLE